MKKSEITGNVKLGFFVIAGLAILIIALYLIGSKQNLFGSTIKINATFGNVSGLMPGNNVRYGGIDIGTVDEIGIINDSTIVVSMIIEKDAQKYLKRNARAGIGSDGLMGNRLINLIATPGSSEPIREGDMLQSVSPVETDEMVRTLSVTNDNLAIITNDLKNLTKKITKHNSLVNILTDTSIAVNIHSSMIDFRNAASTTSKVTLELKQMMNDISDGKGVLGTLINDTSAAANLRSAMHSIALTADTLLAVSNEIKKFSEGMNDPEGLMHVLTRDSVAANDFKKTVSQIQQSTVTLEENLKAMRSNFLFRKYFKNQDQKSK